MASLDELKAIALARLSAAGGDELAISAVDRVVGGVEGREAYVFTGVPRTRWNLVFGRVALSDTGTVLDTDAILRDRALEPVFDTPPDTEVDPDDIDLPPVTITPATNDLTLAVCETFTETITVNIPAQAGVVKADVYFLADTTGSMGGILGAVQAGASSVLGSLAALGLDIAYGVGNYQDFPYDPYAFQHQLSPTNVQTTVQNAINAWGPGGGGDTPEGQLFALDQLAVPPGGTIGWRTGAKRIIVWFGDAPAHEPICTAISGLGYTITEASVTAKLVAENITVVAISTNTGPGLDADPVPMSGDYNTACGAPGGGPNQATNIANATGGQHQVGINAGTIANTIVTLVQNAINTINNVSLVPTGSIPPFVTSITPAGGYGPLDGTQDNTLDFTVTFTGGAYPCTDTPQVFTGTIDVVIDGVVRAQKPTRITQLPCGYVYSVKFLCGTQEDEGECAPVLPGIYRTEINIHNPHCSDVEIRRRIIPVVAGGEVIGRDPEVSCPIAEFDALTLTPHCATMEDCCWLRPYLEEAGFDPNRLSIGFIEIRSNKPIAVTAVYTTSTLDGTTLDMELETYQPIRG